MSRPGCRPCSVSVWTEVAPDPVREASRRDLGSDFSELVLWPSSEVEASLK